MEKLLLRIGTWSILGVKYYTKHVYNALIFNGSMPLSKRLKNHEFIKKIKCSNAMTPRQLSRQK